MRRAIGAGIGAGCYLALPPLPTALQPVAALGTDFVPAVAVFTPRDATPIVPLPPYRQLVSLRRMNFVGRFFRPILYRAVQRTGREGRGAQVQEVTLGPSATWT
ncbi:hypothetical protein [Acidicapsa acidisoli]|uniref:hypothetical protein n=1 Tax=Acidicapsa acidisoli TaxID=1615681 RepID=UPI0021DFAD8E|nr:hypothetical protein [Acidicapsa acidisoli]